MCNVTVTTQHLHTSIDLKPSADFVTCLIPALLAALPAFVQAFMSCLSGAPTTGEYTPGDRPRCT